MLIILISKEKFEIKQSIKELVEITQQNENELFGLRNHFKSSLLSYSQKIEITGKIDKLLRSNQENNEIREKLIDALKVLGQK